MPSQSGGQGHRTFINVWIPASFLAPPCSSPRCSFPKHQGRGSPARRLINALHLGARSPSLFSQTGSGLSEGCQTCSHAILLTSSLIQRIAGMNIFIAFMLTANSLPMLEIEPPIIALVSPGAADFLWPDPNVTRVSAEWLMYFRGSLPFFRVRY